jgi:hypothetical protein
MATSHSFDFTNSEKRSVRAHMLQAGDFFSRNGNPWICLGKFETALDSEIRCARLEDMKTFTVQADDYVDVYSEIKITYKRI